VQKIVILVYKRVTKVEEMQAKVKYMKGCQSLAEIKTQHKKACTLRATEPERLKAWENMVIIGNSIVLAYP